MVSVNKFSFSERCYKDNSLASFMDFKHNEKYVEYVSLCFVFFSMCPSFVLLSEGLFSEVILNKFFRQHTVY